LESNAGTTKTSFLIKETNIFCENEYFQEPGLIENMAQTAAAGSGIIAKQKNEKVRTGFIGAIKNLKIYSFPKIGDTIFTQTKTDFEFDDFSIISAEIMLEDKIIAECEFKIILI
jgi:predicted hotdog family 3-hydroxylacyl-ACP dehydratase